MHLNSVLKWKAPPLKGANGNPKTKNKNQKTQIPSMKSQPQAPNSCKSQTLDLHHIYWERFKCPIDGLFFSTACATVRGQAEAECAGIRCYCPADSDALPHSEGHVSANMYYQNPKTNVGG